MPRRLQTLAVAGALVGALLLASAAGANAAPRFAAPGGAGPTPCAERNNPCSLFDAASLAASSQPAKPGDEVVLAPGNYTDTAGDLGAQDQILLDREVSLHGEAGKPRPVITLEHGVLPALAVEFEDSVSHLEIDSAVAPSLIAIHGGTVDDLLARSSRSGGGIACALTAGILRDSACLSSGSRGTALGLEAVGTQSDFQEVAFLRNVTAVATGSESTGMKFQVTGTGQSRPIFVVNGIDVISRGVGTDVIARGLSLQPGTPGTGADVELALNHSDYATTVSQSDGGGGIVVVTAPNTADNVQAPPLLASDGFHELPGSPTVEAGDTDLLSGEHDIDGQARVIGSIPVSDIGADELARPVFHCRLLLAGPLEGGRSLHLHRDGHRRIRRRDPGWRPRPGRRWPGQVRGDPMHARARTRGRSGDLWVRLPPDSDRIGHPQDHRLLSGRPALRWQPGDGLRRGSGHGGPLRGSGRDRAGSLRGSEKCLLALHGREQ